MDNIPKMHGKQVIFWHKILFSEPSKIKSLDNEKLGSQLNKSTINSS